MISIKQEGNAFVYFPSLLHLLITVSMHMGHCACFPTKLPCIPIFVNINLRVFQIENICRICSWSNRLIRYWNATTLSSMPHKDLEEGIRCIQTLGMPGTFCMPLLNSCSATTFWYSCYSLGASGLQMQLRSQNNVSSNFRLDGLRFSKINDSFTVKEFYSTVNFTVKELL